MSKYYLADVIPLRRLPRTLDLFTYTIPRVLNREATPGRIVLIPFKQQVLYGIIEKVRCVDHITGSIKAIAGVTSSVLTKQQLTIIEFLSHYYYQSKAIIAKSFVALPPRRVIKERAQEWYRRKEMRMSQSRNAVRSGYIFFSHYQDIVSYIAQVIKQIPHNEQIVIITPERSQREKIIDALGYIGILKNSVVIPPHQKKNAYFYSWQQSRSARIIIGSTTALFMPFSNLQQIIVFEAEHHGFQSAEQNPKYHIADFIFSISKIYKSDILLTGFSPDITLLHNTRSRKLPVKSLGSQSQFVDVISVKNYSPQDEFYPVSLPAMNVLSQGRGKALIICNRHGDARMIVCRDCGFQALCENCTKPLMFNADTKKMVCVVCKRNVNMYVTCPRCRGINLMYRGMGISALVKLLRRRFPKYSIVEMSTRRPLLLSEIRQSDIIVATNKIFSQSSMHFDCAIMINPDADLHLSNIHAAESLRHYIVKLHELADHVYIQTVNPEHYVFSTLRSVRDFYTHEIMWRKKFNYPPFSKIIKLTLRDKDTAMYAEKVRALREVLSGISFMGPFERKIRHDFYASVVFRHKPSLRSSKLDSELAKSYNWLQIEVNSYELT